LAEDVNRAREQARNAARVDHCRLAAQGVDREAQVHLGLAVVAMTAHGTATNRAEVARKIGCRPTTGITDSRRWSLCVWHSLAFYT
jgi:hypothetical protein